MELSGQNGISLVGSQKWESIFLCGISLVVWYHVLGRRFLLAFLRVMVL